MAELLKDISVTQLQELLEAHSKATEERILVEVCSFVDILERQLNEMIEMFVKMGKKMSVEDRLKEFVGHTPLQVLMGALLGILVALFIYL